MLKNYMLVALRNLLKHKGYSLINIAGLAVGMACCIFILAFVLHETSYDRFHENSDRIFRIATDATIAGRNMKVSTVSAPMGPQLVEDYPEVLAATRFRSEGDYLLKYGDRQYLEKNVLFGDTDVFKVFSYELLRGDPATALDAAYSIVLTERAAKKYFGEVDPIGKVLRSIDSAEDLTVTGVMKDPPSNSHLGFDMLVSLETFYKRSNYGMDWHNFNFQTYLLLAEGTDPEAFEAKLADFNEKYLSEFMGALGIEIVNFLQPLTSIHLQSHLENEIGNELSTNGDARYVYTFAAIGVFILLLACINFMNLSTARSAGRAREVGLRKVLGAERGRLVRQFLLESLLMAVLSMGLAVVLVAVFNPWFQRLAGQEIGLSFLTDPRMIAGSLALVLFTGIAAGSYPALFLSRFRPSTILKSGRGRVGGGRNFRRALVVFQFAISIALIIGTGIIARQLDYMRNMDLGFQKEQVLVLSIRDAELTRRSEALKQELRSIRGVSSASMAMMVPGENNFNASAYVPEGWKEGETVLMMNITVDEDFLQTLGIGLVSGRDFSRDFKTDQGNAVILNSAAAAHIGWDDPVGKKIYYGEGGDYFEAGGYYTVVGVMEDFHARSLHHAVEPLMLRCSTDHARRMAVRVETSDIAGVLAGVEKVWKSFSGGRPFEYFFLDDYFDGLYRSEERLAGIFKVFTVFAVFIGCLGLFGLVSFAAEQRTREIGIRKVLGSTEREIVTLLCREFILLVVLANLLAWPVSWLLMRRWLEGFPYQAGISPVTFVAAGLGALVIAMLTVSYRAVRAAMSNPVEALRYE